MDEKHVGFAAGSPEDASPAHDAAWQDPSSTGPLSPQAINEALAMNQHYYAESQAEDAAERKRGRRVIRWFGLAAAVAGVAVVGLLGYLQLLVHTVSQIDDERVVADIMADEDLLQGSASDAFVVPSAYAIDTVEVTDRQTDGSDVVVKADVHMSNEFFSESRKVTVRYADEGGTWSGTCTVDSHEVHPLRGIAGDEEMGIAAEDAAFDEASQTCTASRWVESAPEDTWYLTTQGTEYVNYAFADDAWTRVGVDSSQLVPSFATLAGSYAPVSGQATFVPTVGGAGQLQDLEVTWVDDATGTFGGTFTWTSGSSRTFSASQESGEFDGWIDRDGNVGAKASGEAGTLEFTGRAGESGALNLDYTVYYNGFDRYFGADEVSQASGSVTLYQGGSSSSQDVEGGQDHGLLDDLFGKNGVGEPEPEGYGSAQTFEL